MSKISYMDARNLLSESVLGSLFKIIKAGKLKKFVRAAKDPKIKKSMMKLHKAAAETEAAFAKEFGVKAMLDRYDVTDFLT